MNKFSVLTASVFMILVGCDSEPLASPSETEPQFAVGATAALNQDLARVRAATARFHDVNTAIAEGYAPVSECVAIPGVGGMGFHYANMALIMDAGYSADAPEALLYEPRPDGSLKLVAVEYVIVQDFWHGAGNAGLPEFHGRPFDITPAAGPNPATYTLHAWVWTPNRKGVLEPFNPAVTCPSDGGHAHNH
jgi:hypothetical protein